MSHSPIEERLRQVERQLAELQATLTKHEPTPGRPEFPPRKISADDFYWDEREHELAKINFIPPIDSTAIVSEDRDGA